MLINQVSLFSWNNSWKRQLKEIDELLFITDIRNISEYLVEYLETTTSKLFTRNSYEKKLLILLNKRIQHNNLESIILRKINPTLISTLESLLTSALNANTISDSDIQNLSKLIKKLHNLYENKKYYREIENRLIKNLKNNVDDETNYLTLLLIRSLLTKFSEKKLEKLPEEIFARCFFEQNWPKVEKIINNDKIINYELDKFLKSFLKFGQKRSNVFTKTKKLDKFLKYIDKNSLSFDSHGYWMIQRNFETLNSSLSLKSITSKNSMIQNVTLFNSIKQKKEFSDMIDSIFYEILLTNSKSVIYNIFSKINPIHDSPISNNKFCSRYSKLLKSEIYTNPKDSDNHDFKYTVSIPTFYSICDELAIILSKQLLCKTSSIKNSFKKSLCEYITCELNKEENYKIESISLFESILRQFQFVMFQITFLRNTSCLITKKIFSELNYLSECKLNSNRQIILNDISKKLLKELSRELHFRSVPNDVTVQLFQNFIKELFLETKKTTKFRIFCIIGSFDCNHRIFKIGNITFYDGNKFDFGEGTSFDRHYDSRALLKSKYTVYEKYDDEKFSLEFKRNSGRAFVDIEDTESEKAIQSAMDQIRKTLSTFVYWSMSSAKTSGFEPVIPSQYVARTKDLFSGTSRIEGPLSRELIVNDEFEPAIKFYEKIIGGEKKYDEILIKAFSLYQKAKWEKITRDKFLAFWIGLEQLIMTASDKYKLRGQKIKLLEFVPKLTATWRHTDVNIFIWQYLRGISKIILDDSKLVKLLNNDVVLKDWNQNYAILLENLSTIKTLSNNKKLIDAVVSLENYLTPNLQKSILRQLVFLRQREKFKIARLYVRRNVIVHRGNIFTPELDLMTKGLETVFTNLIRPFLNFRNDLTLKQIIFENNRPYNIRDRNLI